MKTMWEQALDYLYRNLKRTRISIADAERKPVVKQTELGDLKGKAEIIEWIISVVLKEEME